MLANCFAVTVKRPVSLNQNIEAMAKYILKKITHLSKVAPVAF